MSLSACLITRNDEKSLARLLRSVAGLANETIVADTGSTDATVAIAQEHAARVSRFAWDDDFAAARNFALDQATGDWALSLNPDEEVPAAGHDAARAGMAHADALAYAVRVQDLLQAGRPGLFTETVQVRLFRRLPALRFAGRLHPHFEPPVEEVARRAGKQVGMMPTVIQRHAYLSVLTEAKLRWALRLLERELRDRPGQLPYLIEYGRTLLLLNDPRGHEVLAEASDRIVPLRDAPTAPTPLAGQLLEYLLTVSPGQSRSRLTRAQARALALRWFPHSPPVLWRVAEHHFQTGDFRQAAALLERLVECGRTGVYDRSQGFDPSILSDPAVMNLGICYLRLAELNRAEQCFRQLLGSPTHAVPAAQNLHMVQGLR
jgi:hypothetical protein